MQNPDQHIIRSVSELRAEMQRVRTRIDQQEEELGKRWKQVPGEAAKSAITAILPLFIGGQLGTGAWKLVKGVFELIKGKKDKEGTENNWKEDVTGGAAKLGLFTGIKLLLNLWKGK